MNVEPIPGWGRLPEGERHVESVGLALDKVDKPIGTCRAAKNRGPEVIRAPQRRAAYLLLVGVTSIAVMTFCPPIMS